MAPTVSVLLPAFNAERTIGVALRSVIRQTYRDWECILIDDGSSDATLAVARAVAGNDARFRIFAHEHQGLISSLNAGINYCRGEFIMRMDADDVMHRDRVALQTQALEEDSSLAALGAHVRLFPREDLRDGRRRYEAWLNSITDIHAIETDAFIECPIAHPTLVLRATIAKQYLYRDRGWPEDYDLILRMLHDGLTLGVVPKRLLSWRDTPERLSRTDPLYGQERFVSAKAHFIAERLRARDTAERTDYVLWGHGPTGRALRRALSVEGFEPTHIVEVHPRRLGLTLHNAVVIPPDGLAALHSPFIVAAVAGATPRGRIRQKLRSLGFVELRDFICAA